MLEDIKSNISRLIALYETERQRADTLAARLSESEEKAVRYREQITELNQKIDSLGLSNAFVGGNGNAVAKERIEKLIGEIDKCIKLLEN